MLQKVIPTPEKRIQPLEALPGNAFEKNEVCIGPDA